MIPEQMKAAVCTKYGTPEVIKIEWINTPVPKPNEILIKVMASSINSGDVRVRALDANGFMKLLMQLLIGFRKPRKPVLGTVYAGVVVKIGRNVKRFKTGDEVYGLCGFGFGTHAEYLAVKERSIITAKPVNASFAEAAALPFGGQTAIYFLDKTRIASESGLQIMIYGASGAVGTASVQIARHYKACITAVCSNTNRNMVLNLGADRVIAYNEEDYTQTNTRFDVILDAVGKLKKKQCQHLLKPGGQFLTVGGLDYASESEAQLLLLKTLFESGSYTAVIDRTYNIDMAAEAHRYVESGRKKGNVVFVTA